MLPMALSCHLISDATLHGRESLRSQRERFFIREMQQIGKTRGTENHGHDLIHELSKRLDALLRYDQYIIPNGTFEVERG